MNKDELLKIYSAYLPYKTPITLASEEYNYDGLTTILSPHYLLDWQRNKCKISLHLWDLSYLTKEIEHEGEKFVPFNILSPKIRHEIEFSKLPAIGDFKVKDYQKLLEWHFNVFNLPEDQFINKATLTK